MPAFDLSYTQNRQLSWLAFNRRVLDQAARSTLPLLERLKFLSIFSTNLDEFFMVRIGRLTDLSQTAPNTVDNKSGLTPRAQLNKIFETIKSLTAYRDRLYQEIAEQLYPFGIKDVAYDRLNKTQKKYADRYYNRLSAQIFDVNRPFLHLKNKALYAVALLRKDGREKLGVASVPRQEIIFLPKSGYIRTEEIVAAHLKDSFPEHEILYQATIRVTRNANIYFDKNTPDHIKKRLEKRGKRAPVRLEIEGKPSPLDELLRRKLQLNKNQVYHSSCPLRTEYMPTLSTDKRLHIKKRKPAYPAFLNPSKRVSTQVRSKDALLFYPYHSIKPFLSLLKEAAEDPKAISIKITIYRLSYRSAVAKYLCKAADNGKDVTVVMELRARFDEHNNIKWSKRLQEHGCRVLYGTEKFKCHSKLCLITYKHKNKFSYITQVGTGNYNEQTAAQYTDLCLITADTQIAQDAETFFKNIAAGVVSQEYKRLLVAPAHMKRPLIKMIEQEAKKGEKGRIFIKANAITDRQIIDALASASQRGAQITMIIRGICCLLPNVPGKTDNISITGIVGQYLEHSRIYAFGTGKKQKIYISSADMMTRNQTRRIEVACPIDSPALKKTLNRYIAALCRDTINARVLRRDGTYAKKHGKPFNSQQNL